MEGRTTWPGIQYVEVVAATAEHPRNDSASIVELAGGELFMVWIEMHASDLEANDEAPSSIASMRSSDGGRSWGDYRIVASPREGDLSVYNPSLALLPDDDLLFFYLRYHCLDFDKPLSSTGCIRRSSDGGRSFGDEETIWAEDAYGCANDTFTLTASGRLLKSVEYVPIRGYTADNGHSSGCFASEDFGRTWRPPEQLVGLPLRGTMENHVAETNDGELLMVMRTQMGGPFIARSTDDGRTWSPAQPSGLAGPESMPCLKRIPRTGHLLLLWNASQFDYRYDHSGKRTPLSAAISKDGGRSWTHIRNLEDDPAYEFSNIGCTFTSNGEAIVTYFTCRMEDPSPPGRFGRRRMSLKAAILPIERLYA